MRCRLANMSGPPMSKRALTWFRAISSNACSNPEAASPSMGQRTTPSPLGQSPI
jgi:hypothetical protein